MYTKINMPHGLNSGSCKALIEYLNKEEKGFFFNQNDNKCSKEEAINSIDKSSKKGIRKDEDKFYMLSFSPSKNELNHLVGREVNSIDELSFEEKTSLYLNLRNYTHNSMDIYAKNFNRNTVKDRTNLTYCARIETERTYNYYDKEVKNDTAKVGDKKEGLQVHIHVVVSRKSADGKVMLSPNAKFRGASWNRKDTGKRITRGFDYTNFTQHCSAQFTEQFNIPTRKYHQKSISNMNAGVNKAKSAVKGQTMKHVNTLLGENLKVERQFLSKASQVVSVAKQVGTIATAITAGTNPASGTKAVIQLAVRVGKMVHAAAAGI